MNQKPARRWQEMINFSNPNDETILIEIEAAIREALEILPISSTSKQTGIICWEWTEEQYQGFYQHSGGMVEARITGISQQAIKAAAKQILNQSKRKGDRFKIIKIGYSQEHQSDQAGISSRKSWHMVSVPTKLEIIS